MMHQSVQRAICRRWFGSIRSFRALAVLAGAAALIAPQRCRADLITFSDQPAGYGAVSPATYSLSLGGSAPVTATFTGFNRYGADSANPGDWNFPGTPTFDHTVGTDVGGRALSVPQPKKGAKTFVLPTLTFSSPVQVNSLWYNISLGEDIPPYMTANGTLAPGSTLQVTGYLNGQMVGTPFQWAWETFPNGTYWDDNGNYGVPPSFFQQITALNGVAVDELTFATVDITALGDYTETPLDPIALAIDDLTITAVPEPASIGIVAAVILLVTLWRPGRRNLALM